MYYVCVYCTYTLIVLRVIIMFNNQYIVVLIKFFPIGLTIHNRYNVDLVLSKNNHINYIIQKNKEL